MADSDDRISLIRSTRRLIRGLDSLLLALKRREPALYSRLANIAKTNEKPARIQATLIESLKDGDAGVRQNAAWALGSLVDLEPVAHKKIAQRDTLTALLDALGSERTAAVVLCLVDAIAKLGGLYPNEVKQPLIGQLSSPDSSVVVAAVHGLSGLGLTVVPDLVGDLTKLAQDGTSTDVRIAACDALGELGRDAFNSLAGLLHAIVGSAKSKINAKQEDDESSQKVPRSETPPELQRAAIGAIVQIDTTGEYLVYEVEPEDRDCILDLLRRIGADSSKTYDRLHSAWIEAIPKGPPSGHKRMQLKDIQSFIFAPQKVQEKHKRNLSNWMASRALRAIWVWKGTYDVNTDDLDLLRKIQLNRSSCHDDSTEKSDLDE